MKQIGNDFQGWPVTAMTLGEILHRLGFRKRFGLVCINANDPILKAYPRLLTDDGMGYGIRPEFVTEADRDTYEVDINAINYEVGEDPKLSITPYVEQETIKVFNLFRDVPEHPIEEDDE